MLREIRKKLVILHNRSPFPENVKEHLKELEYREWIYMNMELSASSLSREQIDAILQGQCVLEAAVEDHLMLERLNQLRNYIYQLTDMGSNLSLQVIRGMHTILTGADEWEGFRRTDGIVQEYGTALLHTASIPAALEGVVYFAGKKEEGENPLEKAALIHNRMLEIYPYEEGNASLARAVMYYILADAGYPLAAVKLGCEEYRQLFLHYLKLRDSSGLAKVLGQAVLERLELMMELTRYEI